VDAFDLDAYFCRIGYRGATRPDLATLNGLVYHHARAIPFENLDQLVGRPVELDAEALQRKLVAGGRGGYCYEHNLLLRHALTRLGFVTSGLAARVQWGRAASAPPPGRTHMALRVELDEGPYLADVGFGGLTLTAALRLEPEVVQSTPHDRLRLRPRGPELDLQTLLRNEWSTLYTLDMSEATLADYEIANWYLTTHPGSRFLHELMVARAGDDHRLTLHDRVLRVHGTDGATRVRELLGASDVIRVLENEFGLDLRGMDDLESALELRLSPPGASYDAPGGTERTRPQRK